MTPQETLIKAAELIEEHGWDRHTYYDPDTDCYCVDGAIMAVTGHEPMIDGYRLSKTTQDLYDRDAAEQLLMEHLGISTIPALFRWNDDPDRTKEEVVSALKAAANVQ